MGVHSALITGPGPALMFLACDRHNISLKLTTKPSLPPHDSCLLPSLQSPLAEDSCVQSSISQQHGPRPTELRGNVLPHAQLRGCCEAIVFGPSLWYGSSEDDTVCCWLSTRMSGYWGKEVSVLQAFQTSPMIYLQIHFQNIIPCSTVSPKPTNHLCVLTKNKKKP